MADEVAGTDMLKPGMPRRLRFVLCRGQYCNLGRRADQLYSRLEMLVREMNGDRQPARVKLETANCLSLCGAGPNLIVYPANAVFNGVTLDQLEAIAAEYAPD